VTDHAARAPAAREKLVIAEEVLAHLEVDVGAMVLEASEGKAGAEKALAAHRSKIELAERHVSEMRRAVLVAEKFDREATAAEAAAMRASQMESFKSHIAARAKSMAVVLEAAAAMAKAYGEYSEATLAAANTPPSGTSIPVKMIGVEGFAGPAFGPCDKLILAELYRLAPERCDRAGRFILPFAKAPRLMDILAFDRIRAGIDELADADRAIILDIEAQLARLDEAECLSAAESAA
jgi:hypothetical protein